MKSALINIFCKRPPRASAARTATIASLSAAWMLFACGDAHAYLDPGSGSYVFQIMIAGIVGAGFAIKMYWKKIISFITGKFKK